MSIKIDHIRKVYRTSHGMKEVLSDITFEVPAGKLFALTGQNGAGKTTLLKILAALVVPDSGEAFIGTDSIARDPLSAKRRLGLVFDPDRSFYQTVSADGNLRFYAALFNCTGKSYLRRRDILAEVLGLGEWLETPVSHCSSGVKQRLAIARALLPRPDVILIDELSRSLDPDAERRVSACLRKLVTDENKTALVVTHDRHWADAYADATWHLQDGRAERVSP